MDPASATPDFRSTTRHLGPTHLTAAALLTRTPSRRARERPVNSGVHQERLARPARYGAVSTAADRCLAPTGRPSISDVHDNVLVTPSQHLLGHAVARIVDVAESWRQVMI